MLRLIPPAGTPTSLATVIRAVLRRLSGSGGKFADKVSKLLDAKYVFPVGSGRAAQTLILHVLREMGDSGRDEVIVPAYTCYTVPASVVRAGLKVRPIDIDPSTMDYHSDTLRTIDCSRALAINGSNLFGIVSDWKLINKVVKERNVFRIDDAAQSFGVTAEGGPSGMLGDVGFLSLGRGKNLSTYDGGVIVTNDDAIGALLAARVNELPGGGVIGESMLVAKLVAYSLLLRPWLYWLPSSLPFLGLGQTVYDENFAIQRLSKLQASLGELTIGRLKSLNDHRSAIGGKIASALHESGKYVVAGYNPQQPRVYLRLPVLAADKAARDRAIERVRSIGIAATTMYPDIIANIPTLRPHLVSDRDDYPGAREVIDRLFTLPTHGYMKIADADRIIGCLL